MNSKVFLSIVAPCFNEAINLVEFHRRVSSACTGVSGLGTEWEIVLVNDGSQDQTFQLMQ
jgi:glycosyltransferase involved in cell wall biosynthesis